MTRAATASAPATGILTLRLAGQDFDGFAADLRAALARAPTGLLLDGRGADGPDLNPPEGLLVRFGAGTTPGAARDWAQARAACLREMETAGVPVACLWSGTPFRAGWEIMLAAHARFLEGDAPASSPAPGLLPGGGAVQRLARTLGVEAASALLCGRKADGAALEAAGLWTCCAAGTAEARARDWLAAAGTARQPWDDRGYRIPGGTGATAPHAARSFALPAIAARGRGHDREPAPLALLRALYEGTQLPMDAALAREAQIAGALLAEGTGLRRLRTLVVARARAEAGAGRPQAPRRSFTRLGVIGAGMMGTGIARAAAGRGIAVTLLDRDRESATAGHARIAAALEKAVASGRTSGEAAAATLAGITPAAGPEALAGAELVIEAVFEQTALKQAVTRAALPHLGAETILASNTSTISIDTLGAALPAPGRFLGLHFFSPVERMPLVEIIRGSATSDATLAAALDLVLQLGKTPIVVNTSPGFFTSRIFCTWIDEAMAMLAEGVAPALIENAARRIGAPVGPLAVTDEVSLALQQEVIDQAEADGLSPRFLRGHARPVIARMLGLGRPGRKARAGFYDYPAGGAKRLWPGLAEVFPAAASQPGVEEIGTRLLAIQALDAARCLEEGVVARAEDADLGAVLGVGFPSWTGGPLSYIDMTGAEAFVATCDRLAARHGARFRPSAALRAHAAAGRRFHEGERA